MKELTEKLSAIAAAQLGKEYTSVSYAIMLQGELVAADSLGYQNRKTMKPADSACTYNVASVSKIYCTAAVMQLVEKGLVDLDTPVYTYLPRFQMPLDPRYRQITLRHCLCHASGLPGTQWRGFSVSDAAGSDYYADVYDYLAKSTLKADPGAYSVYCNDGFTLAEMTVAEVAGIPFAEYCRDHLTEPLGAHSTRLAPVQNKENTLVAEGKRPAEYLLIEGGAGITTTMADLCLFGNSFLENSPILSRASMEEMAKPQGRTFLKKDQRSPLYGLGWDNVAYEDEKYDLGKGVLLKGGNSFQFDTQFLVIPRYKAVLAISETHDCKLDINGLILRLFATVMLERGVNIYRKYAPVSNEIKEEYAGVYLTPCGAFDLRIDGAAADAVRLDSRGQGGCVYHDLLWNGTEFEGEKNQQFLFDKDEKDRFLMTRLRTKVTGCAMKATAAAPLSPVWEKRIGKKYLPCDLDANDIVIYEIMSGLKLFKPKEIDGTVIFSFSGRADSGVYGFFESAVRPVDENRGKCFLRTPANPSRDLIDPIFWQRDGVEYCSVASYTYQEESSLPIYEGQCFPNEQRKNGLYRLGGVLEKLPEIPEGRRLMVLDDDMVTVYDNLFSEKYVPVEKGYLILI